MTPRDDSDQAPRQAQRTVDEILADPALKKRLVEALQADLESAERAHLWDDRLKPFLAGLSSAVVVVLAFLIPSLQDLWDRYEAHRTIDRYAEIGRRLLAQGQFTAAEQTFDRALELAANGRPDLYDDKMRARVGRVDEDPEWRGSIPEDLTESDFLYLLEAQSVSGHPRERASTLTVFGAFLVSKGRFRDAEQRLRAAIELDPAAGGPHVNLGNLLADLGDAAAAEAEFRRALELDPEDSAAHYDLAVLLAEAGRSAEAAEQFLAYTRLAPDLAQGFVRLGEQLGAQGRRAEARAAFERALALDRSDREAKAGLAALGLRR